VTAGSPSLVNLRDLGGLPLEDGGRTAAGVLLRSDAPYPGDLPPTGVTPWPPAVVLDLRSEAEVRHRPSVWPAGTDWFNVPLHDAAVPRARPADDVDFSQVYLAIVDEVPHRIAGLLHHVAEATGPVLIHCTAGKDRTGIVVAALLLAGGVRPRAVLADYRATERSLGALRRRWVEHGIVSPSGKEVPEAWLRAPEESMAPVVERITGWPGGARGWWLEHGAAARHLDQWNARLRS
jgi:protein-tyrosine phosphatase